MRVLRVAGWLACGWRTAIGIQTCVLYALACETPAPSFDPFEGAESHASGGVGGTAAGRSVSSVWPSAAEFGSATDANEPSSADSVRMPPDSALQELVHLDWELAPGDEVYMCARRTVTAALYANRLRGAFPRGTHHTSLMVAPAARVPDSVYKCGLTEVEKRIVAGGGVGTKDLVLPPGVAMKFEVGNQLLLQIHMFNPTDQALRGRSATLAGTVESSAVQYEADGLVAQLPTLRVPAGESTATGRCTFTRPQTLVGYLPHMHLTGAHAKVILHTGGQDVVVHDRPYVIDQQIWYDFPPVQVQAGDYFDYACTFENTTGKVIYYGEEIEQEMCMIGVTRYPGGGDLNCLR